MLPDSWGVPCSPCGVTPELEPSPLSLFSGKLCASNTLLSNNGVYFTGSKPWASTTTQLFIYWAHKSHSFHGPQNPQIFEHLQNLSRAWWKVLGMHIFAHLPLSAPQNPLLEVCSAIKWIEVMMWEFEPAYQACHLCSVQSEVQSETTIFPSLVKKNSASKYLSCASNITKIQVHLCREL